MVAPNQNPPVTLEGKVTRIRFQKDSFAIFELAEGRKFHSVKGDLPGIREGMSLTVTGTWDVSSAKFGPTLKATAIFMAEKDDVSGLVAKGAKVDRSVLEDYLSSGVLPNVGGAVASRLIAAFQPDALIRIMASEDEYEKLATVNGITKARALAIHQAWTKEQGAYGIFMKLHEFGLTRLKARAVVEALGKNCIEIINKNPYEICKAERIGFVIADKFALANGLPADSMKRVKAALLHALNEAVEQNGSTGIESHLVAARASKLIAQPKELCMRGVSELISENELTLNGSIVYHPKAFACERSIAARLRDLMIEGEAAAFTPFTPEDVLKAEKRRSIELSVSQRDAVLTCVNHPVAILTGQPGTGKTTTLRVILELIKSRQHSYALAAPSGKAAKRMSESCQTKASTEHRLLGCRGDKFVHDKKNPLGVDIINIDEFSMNDVYLTQALFRAIKEGGRVLLIGDHDQIPSVGPGKVLYDLIASQYLPVAHLTELRRTQAGSAVAIAARAVNCGEVPSATSAMGDFPIFGAGNHSASDVGESVVKIVSETLISQGHKLEDIQVLSPMRKGPAGTIFLNQRIQETMNPNASIEGRYVDVKSTEGTVRYAVGDRIIQTQNDYEIEFQPKNTSFDAMFEEPEVGLFNGEVGTVVSVNKNGSLVAQFDEGLINLSTVNLFNVDLAYALTIHKFQGSEAPVVVMPVTYGHYVMLNRNLIYTGITRAKQRTVVVTEEDGRALRVAVQNDDANKRITSLGLHVAEAFKHRPMFPNQVMNFKPTMEGSSVSAPPRRTLADLIANGRSASATTNNPLTEINQQGEFFGDPPPSDDGYIESLMNDVGYQQ